MGILWWTSYCAVFVALVITFYFALRQLLNLMFAYHQQVSFILLQFIIYDENEASECRDDDLGGDSVLEGRIRGGREWPEHRVECNEERLCICLRGHSKRLEQQLQEEYLAEETNACKDYEYFTTRKKEKVMKETIRVVVLSEFAVVYQRCKQQGERRGDRVAARDESTREKCAKQRMVRMGEDDVWRDQK